jgi:hypothetical protein
MRHMLILLIAPWLTSLQAADAPVSQITDRPTKVSGWSTCYPSLTELPDGTLVALWAQIKSSSGELHGDIHSARITVRE